MRTQSNHKHDPPFWRTSKHNDQVLSGSFDDGNFKTDWATRVRNTGDLLIEKAAALREYLRSPEGLKHHAALYAQFLEFYRQVEPDRPYEAATAAATGKVEREHFQFPDFGVWLLELRQPTV